MTTTQVLLVWCAFAAAAAGQEFPGMPRKLTPQESGAELPGMPKKMTPLAPQLPAMAGRAQAAGMLDISGRLISTLVDRPVQKLEAVRDHVLDADVFGTSRTCGKVSAIIQPDCERAFLAIVLQGTSYMDTVGYNDPVKAYTQGILNFQVHQPISIDDKGVHVYPCMAWAQAHVNLCRITNMNDSVESIVVGPGRYQFHEDRRQIEAITARKGERKLMNSLSEELQPQLKKVSQGLNTALGALYGLGVSLRPMRWWSTASHLHGEVGTLTRPPMTAAPDLPPAVDVGLRVHQSVLFAMAQKSLAGKSYSVLDLLSLREKIVDVLGSPKQPGAGVDGDKLKVFLSTLGIVPISIDFSKTTPAEVEIDAAGFTITLHGQSFHQGTTVYPPRDIRARYRIEMPANADAAFVREGSVQISANSPADDPKDRLLRSALELSFNLFLPDRLVLPKITIPGERPLLLVPSHATSAPGWLSLGWTRSEKKE